MIREPVDVRVTQVEGLGLFVHDHRWIRLTRPAGKQG